MSKGSITKDLNMEWLTVAREQLRGTLVMLQEEALLRKDDECWFGVAEVVAEASGQLFQLHQDRPDACEAQADIKKVCGLLALALEKIQHLETGDEFTGKPVDSLSQVVEMLEAMQKEAGGDRASILTLPKSDTPIRKKKGLLLLMDEEEPPTTESPDPCCNHELTKDRRAARRSVLEVEMGLQSESNFYTGLTLDVSTGGIFVATYELLPVGTPVTLEFELPGGDCIRTDGEVRWLRESKVSDLTPGMGIAFTALEPVELDAIRQFCQSRAPLYYDVE